MCFKDDDGPSVLTPQVLAALQDRGLKATFFVIGSNVLRFPEVLIQAYQAGHSIAVHTW